MVAVSKVKKQTNRTWGGQSGLVELDAACSLCDPHVPPFKISTHWGIWQKNTKPSMGLTLAWQAINGPWIPSLTQAWGEWLGLLSPVLSWGSIPFPPHSEVGYAHPCLQGTDSPENQTKGSPLYGRETWRKRWAEGWEAIKTMSFNVPGRVTDFPG